MGLLGQQNNIFEAGSSHIEGRPVCRIAHLGGSRDAPEIRVLCIATMLQMERTQRPVSREQGSTTAAASLESSPELVAL